MMKRFAPVLVLFLLCAFSVSAQNAKLNRADRLFCELAFNEAKNLYLELVAESSDVSPNVYFKLGESYRLLDQPEEAARWYERSVTYTENSPLDYLYLAQMLQQMQRYDEANEWYGKYNERMPNDSRGWRGKLATENYQRLQDNPMNYAIQNVPGLNTPQSDMSPLFFREGIIFASDRFVEKYDKTFQWTGNSFYNMFYAEENSPGSIGNVKLLDGDANDKYHDGPATAYKDGNKIIFTRTHDDREDVDDECPNKKVYNLMLVSSSYDSEDDEWSDPEMEEFTLLNNKNWIVGHPSISSDGQRLYFMSDNKDFTGHMGGTDIYVSRWQDGQWGYPENLGKDINTEGNEKFPFIHQDTILYFSSDGNLGNGGLGGEDIYKAMMNTTTKRFGNVQNMGAPINSSRDDFGLVIREDNEGAERGYFVSSRPGGAGMDDIYAFQPDLPIYLLITAWDECVQKPIEGAEIVWNEKETILAQASTNSRGEYFNEDIVQKERSYTASATYGGVTETADFHTYGVQGGDTVKVRLNFRTFVVGGIVYHKLSNQPLENASVVLMSNGVQVASTATDAEGRYSLPLQPEKEYRIVASKHGYGEDEQVFNTKGQTCGIVKKDLYLEPRPNFLTNVYYYFDKASIYRYPEAPDKLDELVAYLNENPNYKIEIRSHTDSRASFKYNEGLSQRRAQSVKDYLINAGILPDRLTPIAYGEYCLLNQCADGHECTEVQHQRNRRTEIYVLNYDGSLKIQTKEDPKWLTEHVNKYVPGGKYYEVGKGSNWQEDERFVAEHGNWRSITVRKDCGYQGQTADRESAMSEDQGEGYTAATSDAHGGNTSVNEAQNSDQSDDNLETEIVALNTSPGTGNDSDQNETQQPEEEEQPVVESQPQPKQNNPAPKTQDNAVYKIQFAAKTSADLNYDSVTKFGQVETEQAGPYYRFLLGNFNQKSEASKILDQVKSEGYGSAFVVKYVNGKRQ